MTTTSLHPTPPAVAIFDVNETLSDLSGLGPRLVEVGARPDLLTAWFAATLRDGFAATLAGANVDFASIAVPTLAMMLGDEKDLRGSAVEAAEHVVEAMADLDLHPDVAPGINACLSATSDAGSPHPRHTHMPLAAALPTLATWRSSRCTRGTSTARGARDFAPDGSPATVARIHPSSSCQTRQRETFPSWPRR